MNRCPRCGESAPANFVVCHACGYLPAPPDEFKLQPATERSAVPTIPSEVLQDVENGAVKIKEPIAIEPDKFTEYVLPWILIALGIGPNIYLSIRLAGPLGIAAVVIDIAMLLFVQVPITAGILMVVGLLFGISFGLLWTGVIKLAAISVFVRGLVALSAVLLMAGFTVPAGLVLLVALISQVWLVKSLFELDVFETIVCLVALVLSLSLLQYAIFLLIATVMQPAPGAVLLGTC